MMLFALGHAGDILVSFFPLLSAMMLELLTPKLLLSSFRGCWRQSALFRAAPFVASSGLCRLLRPTVRALALALREAGRRHATLRGVRAGRSTLRGGGAR